MYLKGKVRMLMGKCHVAGVMEPTGAVHALDVWQRARACFRRINAKDEERAALYALVRTHTRARTHTHAHAHTHTHTHTYVFYQRPASATQCPGWKGCETSLPTNTAPSVHSKADT